MEDYRYPNPKIFAAKIAILYLTYGFLWVLITDNIILYFTSNPIIITRLQTYKGFIFIILTGIIFYIILLYYLKKIDKSINLLSEKKGELDFILSNINGIVYRIEIEEGKIRFPYMSEGPGEIGEYLKDNLLPFDWLIKNTVGDKEMMQRIDEFFKKEEVTTRHYFTGKDGKIFYFLNRARVIRDVKGKPLEIVGFMTDITDLKRMEDELRELTSRLTTIIDASPAAIITMDQHGVVTSWNRSATRIFGWSEEEVLGKLNPIIQDDSGELNIIGNKLLRLESIFDVRFQLPRKDKKYVDVILSKAAIIGDCEKLTGIVVTVMDETEHVMLEEQLRHAQRMKAIGEFAGGIAHEFNNLLTAIIGYARLLEERLVLNEDLKNYLNVIIDSSRKASELTKGLLTFSRKQISKQVVLNLNDIVRDVYHLLTKLIGEDIEISLNLSDERFLVKADAAQIEQVLVNFATNARDAMPDGGIVTIKTGIMEMDEQFIRSHGYGRVGRYAYIVFADTGVGMDEQIKQRIFEPFFTTKEVGKGTGLGLAVVYGIVKQHNGFINVYSKPGKGSTFIVYFPLVEDTDVEEVEYKELKLKRVKAEGTVLVAEDDLSVRRFVKRILEDAGYSVIEAEDGEDAIRKFSENKNDIRFIILDVVMPKKDGKEVYKYIKNIKPDIKAIFMSGYPRDVINSRGIIDGEIKLIIKPFFPEELFEKIWELWS